MSGTTIEPPRQKRIDSWKSIAEYLGRSSRTVQRWHRAYGLPVRRLGGDSSSVYAYMDELDSWLRNRAGAAKGTLIELPGHELPRGLNQQPESLQPHRAVDLPCIPGSAKGRSAALVTFAHKISASLSNSNARMIAQLFREAIDLDPGNAEAFAGLSHALIAGGVMGSLRIPEAYVSAKETLQRSFELDAELTEARCAAAWLKMVSDRDWFGARQDFDSLLSQPVPSRRAIVGRALLHIAEGSPGEASSLLQELLQHSALNSRAAALYYWSNYLAGEYRDVLELIEEARYSGHSDPVLDAVEALASIHCEKPDACIARIQAVAADSANHALLRGILGYAFALNSQVRQAKEILEAMTQAVDGKRGADPYAIAIILIALGEKQDATPWLEQSFRRGSLWSLGFPGDPLLLPLRDEPGYHVFLSHANYPVPGRQRQQKDGSLAGPAGLLDPGA
jgi:hypothetical protein